MGEAPDVHEEDRDVPLDAAQFHPPHRLVGHVARKRLLHDLLPLPQAFRHVVEGPPEPPHLVPPGDVDLDGEVALADFLGGPHQRFHGPRYAARNEGAHEGRDQEGDGQRDGAARHDEPLLAVDFLHRAEHQDVDVQRALTGPAGQVPGVPDRDAPFRAQLRTPVGKRRVNRLLSEPQDQVEAEVTSQAVQVLADVGSEKVPRLPFLIFHPNRQEGLAVQPHERPGAMERPLLDRMVAAGAAAMNRGPAQDDVSVGVPDGEKIGPKTQDLVLLLDPLFKRLGVARAGAGQDERLGTRAGPGLLDGGELLLQVFQNAFERAAEPDEPAVGRGLGVAADPDERDPHGDGHEKRGGEEDREEDLRAESHRPMQQPARARRADRSSTP